MHDQSDHNLTHSSNPPETAMIPSRFTAALAFVLILSAAPTAAQIHQWTPESPARSPEQQEVWQTVQRCLQASVDDLALRRDCVHPDFVGFGTDEPIPRKVNDAQFALWFENTDWLWIEATPLHILVHGDLAVVQYHMSAGIQPKGEAMRVIWEGWTDVLRRDDGVWRWIADHGHEARR